MVIDPSEPESSRLDGLLAVVMLENHIPTKNYNLSSKRTVHLVKGNRRFTLTQPKEKQINITVKSLDFTPDFAAKLLLFLRDAGNLSVEVDGVVHPLSGKWAQRVSQLVTEVDGERQRKSYKISGEEIEINIYVDFRISEEKTGEVMKRLPKDKRQTFLMKSQARTYNSLIRKYKKSQRELVSIIEQGRLRNREEESR